MVARRKLGEQRPTRPAADSLLPNSFFPFTPTFHPLRLPPGGSNEEVHPHAHHVTSCTPFEIEPCCVCVYIRIFQSFYVYSSLNVCLNAFSTVSAFLHASVAVADDYDLNGRWHCTHVVSCHLCTTEPCTDTFLFLQDSVLVFSKVYRQLIILHLWLSGNGNCYGLVQEKR